LNLQQKLAKPKLRVAAQRAATHILVLYQFPKVWLHFRELKTKPSKDFKITKWLRHFVIWYYVSSKASFSIAILNH